MSFKHQTRKYYTRLLHSDLDYTIWDSEFFVQRLARITEAPDHIPYVLNAIFIGRITPDIINPRSYIHIVSVDQAPKLKLLITV